MKITRRSIITGIKRTRDLPVTDAQLRKWYFLVPIEYAMPQLSPDDWNWVEYGVTPDEWSEEVEE